jgi:DNA-binding CsgD family transcriptional regulator
MHEMKNFIDWLSYHPSTPDIARALATDYLAVFAVLGIRFSQLQNDDSIIILGEYGFDDSEIWRDRIIPSTEWRARDTEPSRFLTGESKEKWCNNSTIYIETLRDRGVVQGHLMVAFHKSIPDDAKSALSELIQDLCVPLALYLSFQNQPVMGQRGTTASLDSRDAGIVQLSQRQILILRGMVEGKTNHELALEMGFSVSTIRHETMRIFQALAVSDRKEAAKKALTLSLV